MGELSAAALLDAWEDGFALSMPARPLALLRAVEREPPPAELARVPIGERNKRLLDLLRAAFGSEVEAAVTCPGCGSTLELSLIVDELRAASEGASPGPLLVQEAGYEVQFRLPSTDDLVEIAAVEDEGEARRRLFECCAIDARHDGAPVPAARLPEEVVAAVSNAMGRADPGSGIEVAVECPECAHGWRSPFDIASFLWTETDRWARRILGEVHALASAYGWSEAEILCLSARRRQLYLDQIGE